MDKNTIIGIILIAVILIGFSWWNQPSEEEVKAQQEQLAKEKAAKAQAEKTAQFKAKQQQKTREKVEEDTTALFHHALKGTAQDIVLKNGKVELTLSTKGATVEKAIIKNYISHEKTIKTKSNDDDKR